MAKAAKIAVSVDADLLRKIEKIRERTGESRSAAVSRGLRLLAGQHEHDRRVREYVRAYRETSEAPEDVEAARASAKRALGRLPWDDE